jgi:hypothetical protein
LTERRRSPLLGFILIALILIGDIVSGAIGIGSPVAPAADTKQLGTWVNMPANQTELMGNSSYRGLLIASATGGESGIQVSLLVNCINPSNTVGAYLKLQWAFFNEVLNTNSSVFADAVNGFPSGTVPIDGITMHGPDLYPCPGILQGDVFPLPSNAGSHTIFVFRVVGVGGGGLGDNPRFSSVQVAINQAVQRFFSPIIVLTTTTTFRWLAYSPFQVASSTTITIEWIATNITATACITLSNCIEHGTSTCTIPAGASNCGSSIIVTFTNAFSAAPDVVATAKTAGSLATVPAGNIDLLLAQTLTV